MTFPDHTLTCRCRECCTDEATDQPYPPVPRDWTAAKAQADVAERLKQQRT